MNKSAIAKIKKCYQSADEYTLSQLVPDKQFEDWIVISLAKVLREKGRKDTR